MCYVNTAEASAVLAAEDELGIVRSCGAEQAGERERRRPGRGSDAGRGEGAT